MDVYAIIKTGGKQYRVAPGDIVKVEKLAAAPGATVQIDEVYMLVNDRSVTAGTPVIPNARVVAEVVEEGRDPKIIVFKMKRRKGYRRTIGHRQHYTTLRISEIALGDAVYRPKANGAVPAVPDAGGTTAAPTPPPASVRPTPARMEPVKPAEVPVAPLPTKTPPTESIPAPVIAASPRDPAPIAPPPATPPSVTPAEAREPAATAPAVAIPPAPPRTTIAATIPAPISKTDAIGAPARHDRRYWLAAALAVLLLAVIGFFFIGSREQAPEEIVPIAAPAPEQAAPPQAAKPKPAVRDVAIEEPAAVSAPSVPAQPPD